MTSRADRTTAESPRRWATTACRSNGVASLGVSRSNAARALLVVTVASLLNGCPDSFDCVAVSTYSMTVYVTRCGQPACAEVTATDGSHVVKLGSSLGDSTGGCGLVGGFFEAPGRYTVVVKAGDQTVTIEDVVLIEGVCDVYGPDLLVELEDDAAVCAAQAHAASWDGAAGGDDTTGAVDGSAGDADSGARDPEGPP